MEAILGVSITALWKCSTNYGIYMDMHQGMVFADKLTNCAVKTQIRLRATILVCPSESQFCKCITTLKMRNGFAVSIPPALLVAHL